MHQPETEVLAPTFALRQRLFTLGLAFVGLFLLFAGLSVRSVVLQVTRLTRGVKDDPDTSGELESIRLGQDEVGELARAMVRWRGRMLESEEHLEAIGRRRFD